MWSVTVWQGFFLMSTFAQAGQTEAINKKFNKEPKALCRLRALETENPQTMRFGEIYRGRKM